MGAKIQADEISSIIKERIDNFELNIDKENKIVNNGLKNPLKYYSNYHKKYKKKKF